MYSTLVLLQAEGQSAPGGMISMLLPLGILVIFYLFFIRPQQKRQKEERIFREGLEKGDKVLTIGGIYGRIVSLDETSALIQVDENVKVRFDKTALRPTPEAKSK